MVTRQREGYMFIAVSSDKQKGDKEKGTDKVSLEEQERVGRKFFQEQDIHFDDRNLFTVPGHSRHESDLEKMFIEYRKAGITAYDDIANVWRSKKLKAGDVLVIYHDSRAARSKTGYMWMIENWLRNGGEVYSIIGGWINKENEDFRAAMGAITATQGIKLLQAARPAGMRKRASQGKATSNNTPYFHSRPRDPLTGKDLPLVVDREQHQRLIEDLYDVVVNQHTAWNNVEGKLESLGHRDKDGGSFPYHKFYNIVRSAPFWGNISYNIGDPESTNRRNRLFALWVIDEAEKDSKPEDVTIEYNKCESVYSGEQRMRFLNEIRISMFTSGRLVRHKPNAFSGFLVCDECGQKLAYHMAKQSRHRGYSCPTHASHNRRLGKSCSQFRSVRFDKVQDWFTARLCRLLETHDTSIFLPQSDSANRTKHISTLSRDLAKQRQLVENMTMRIADAPANSLSAIYSTLEKLSERRDQIAAELNAYEASQSRDNARHDEVSSVLNEIEALGSVEAFFEKSEADIHSALALLLGNLKIVARDGEIIGTMIKS